MAVRYINVKSETDLFSPVVRSTGNVAIIGTAAKGTDAVPKAVTRPSEAAEMFGPATIPDPTPGDPNRVKPNSSLTAALTLLFNQSPGPGQVWGVRSGNEVGPVADPSAALGAIETLNVQFVVLAATPLDEESGKEDGAIGKLVSHVTSVSLTGGEGMERIGVAMLAKDVTDANLVEGKANLINDRMIYIAHKSDQDAAAAVAGTVAGYPPHISMLLKRVAISSDPFTAAQIDALNGREDFGEPPSGKGINWLDDPVLISGGGIYMGEGYTGDPGGGIKFIDVRRTLDDVSFRLKARLIQSVGTLRISRSGLRSLVVQMETVLNQFERDEVVEGYAIVIPVLDLLDADPAALTAAQLQEIQQAQADRIVQILVSIDYAGAIHRIALKLNFV